MFCLPREAMAHILIDSEVVGIKISSPLYKFSIYSCAGRNHCRYSLVLGMVTVPVNTGTFKNATLELPFHSRAAGQRQSPIRHGTCILSTSIHPAISSCFPSEGGPCKCQVARRMPSSLHARGHKDSISLSARIPRLEIHPVYLRRRAAKGRQMGKGNESMDSNSIPVAQTTRAISSTLT